MILSCVASTAAGADDSPLTVYENGETILKGTVEMQTAVFHEIHPWWGKASENIGGDGNDWFELALEPGVEGQIDLGPRLGAVYGRVSGLFTLTTGGLDAAGSNLDPRAPTHFALEDAVLGWRSGDALPWLGNDAIQVSFGSQPYRVGSGLLFQTGATNGGPRGAFWIAPRTAFTWAGIARLTTHGLTGEVVFLEPNDVPASNTQLWGTNWEYALGTGGLYGSVGAGVWRVFRSETAGRDELSVYDARADLTPLTGREHLPGLRLAGEFALEQGRRGAQGYAWYGEAGYAFESLPAEPYASYRYAFFSGPDRRSERRRFDPLFYGSSDWGTWYVGEILGNFVLSNRNVVLHTARLRASPIESLTLNLLFHYAELDRLPNEIVSRVETRAANVRSHPIAEELDAVLEWEATPWLSFMGVVGAAFPNDAAKDFAGGSATWVHMMIGSRVAF